MRYLIGASGHAKVILDILRLCKTTVEGFYDDNVELTTFRDLKSLGAVAKVSETKGQFIIAIGSNEVRRTIDSRHALEYYTAIHPSGICDNSVVINEGTVIMAGAIINADSVIGRHVIVNSGAIVEHDCNIGDYAHLSPNCTLSGGVIVGEGAHIGAGAVVIPGVKIGEWAIVGAGTVVIKDVPAHATVVGSPARRIK